MAQSASRKARLIYATSESCADLLYATHFFAPDDFLWFEHKGKKYGVFSQLEIDRAKKQACLDVVLSWEEAREKSKRSSKHTPTSAEVIACILTQNGIRSVQVPNSTSALLVDDLRKLAVNVEVVREEFFPQRWIKTDEEVKSIVQAQRLAEAGMARAVEVLRACKIHKNFLLWGGKKLTAEMLRGEIDATIIKAGGLPRGTIVACGQQACDPHERGHGVLYPHQTLVIDIFPRHQLTGYYGDLTRTFVKGKASEAVRHLYNTVLKAQKNVVKHLKHGADGGKLHQQVVDFFVSQGYRTEQVGGRWQGFFHGTGHGLGLDLHESPRFSRAQFKAGMVTTVEPGLYFPNLGGVRIEDVVVVEKKGSRNLTRCPKFLEIA